MNQYIIWIVGLSDQNCWETKDYASAMRSSVAHPGCRLSADEHSRRPTCNDIRRTNTNTHIPYH